MKLSVHEIDIQKDFEAVKAVFLLAFTGEPWNDEWSEEMINFYLDDLLQAKNSLSYGLYKDDELVGIALGRLMHFYSGNQFRIDEFCVSPKEQGHGLGTTFMELLTDAVKKKDIKYLLLDTNKTYPAYNFYLKNDFQEIKDLVSLYKIISE